MKLRERILAVLREKTSEYRLQHRESQHRKGTLFLSNTFNSSTIPLTLSINKRWSPVFITLCGRVLAKVSIASLLA
ncbi:MAG: hypothetical protein KBONHNOK_01126 [Candidatus Methanoperedenaceae archaeon GB50]|nr:MAG: hypothetical protein KBONHNOK_01126 [Candidatus Methanoperedenaceae archaeon GB50]